MASASHSSHSSNAHSSNVVGVHYRVGKKIGEGSFGVIFEGTNLLNNKQVAIKFVRPSRPLSCNSGVRDQGKSWTVETGVGMQRTSPLRGHRSYQLHRGTSK